MLTIITQTGCSSSQEVEPVSKEGFYLDTVCTISVYEQDGALDREKAETTIDKAYERCRELEKALSRTITSSDVSRINAAGGAWTEVGDDALAVIKAGIHYGEISDGAFDITIGPVSSLWDFEAQDPVVPAASDIEEALTHVDYRQIRIDGNRVRLTDPEAALDLGGIAKGYIADELADLLEEEGVTSAVVNLGGNIVTIGAKPDGTPFRIGIERPFTDRSEIVGSTALENETIVTSGIYERQFEKDGKLYHHVLDSETGYPADTDLEAVSLVAARGHSMDIDAMSTITLMKGKEAGKAFIEAQDGIEAVFIDDEDRTTMTDDMDYEAQ